MGSMGSTCRGGGVWNHPLAINDGPWVGQGLVSLVSCMTIHVSTCTASGHLAISEDLHNTYLH